MLHNPKPTELRYDKLAKELQETTVEPTQKVERIEKLNLIAETLEVERQLRVEGYEIFGQSDFVIERKINEIISHLNSLLPKER